VAQAMRAFVDDTESGGDLHFPRWLSEKERLRQRIASLIGAQPQCVSLTPSTSFGFNIAAMLMHRRGIRTVACLDSEFPSTTVPFLNQGLTLRVVKAKADGSYSVEALLAAASTPNTAVAVSLVQFASGYRLDIDSVAQHCREKQIPLALNAAQALGQVPVHFDRWRADFLAAPSHKWMMSGYGLALLCIAEHWLDEPLPMAGWLSVPPDGLWDPFHGASRRATETGFEASGVALRSDASTLETGGGAWIQMAAMHAALDVLDSVGIEEVQRHNLQLQHHLRAELRRRGFVPNAPDHDMTMSGICGIGVQGNPDDVVRELLREAQVVTTARQCVVRVATHVFNTLEDVDRLVAAIDRLRIAPASRSLG
jgi:cysteine desulfurase / selenocysteine lyase